MKWKRKTRKRKISSDQYIMDRWETIATNIVADLHRYGPIEVKHDIHRNIPKPVTATLIAENTRGEQFRQWMNMSFQNTMIMRFPLFHFTNRSEDQGHYIDISMLLEYDPKDTR